MNEIDVVVDVRQSLDTAELIVLKQKVAFSGEASLVGSPVETRVGLITRKAQLSAFELAEMGIGHVLGVAVKNVGTVPFEIDRVAFVHQFEETQDFTTNTGVLGQQIGGSVDLVPRDPKKIGPLPPGGSRDYFLPARMFDDVALTAASLSPDRFWIAAYCGGEEVGRVAGQYVRPFLDRSGIVIHRRAQPLFDTLPESGRLAVIRAVAPLRGVERDRWSAAGAKAIEGVPLTFVVRAGDDLRVVVTQTEDKGVEIGDIVRKAALDQFAPTSRDGGSKP